MQMVAPTSLSTPPAHIKAESIHGKHTSSFKEAKMLCTIPAEDTRCM